MERQLAALQSTARVILAEAFERAIELACSPDRYDSREAFEALSAEWARVVKGLLEGVEVG